MVAGAVAWHSGADVRGRDDVGLQIVLRWWIIRGRSVAAVRWSRG